MREVAGGYGNCAWTPLGKGRPEVGEKDDTCAVREVREEMGIAAEIVAELPGYFVGTTSATKVYVMRAVGAPGPPDSETLEVRWATLNEARELIALSPSEIVRVRDLAVLSALQSSARSR